MDAECNDINLLYIFIPLVLSHWHLLTLQKVTLNKYFSEDRFKSKVGVYKPIRIYSKSLNTARS